MEKEYVLEVTGQGEYLLIYGGYHSVPNGCPAWGSSKEYDSRFIGDDMGFITVHLEEGDLSIPLIFGYTMWFKSVWQEGGCMPFAKDGELCRELKGALHLNGAFEAAEECFLAVKTDKKVQKVTVHPKKNKEGKPLFTRAQAVSALPEGAKAVRAGYPVQVQEALDKINRALLTFQQDIDISVSRGELLPYNKSGLNIEFSGENAHLLNGVFHENIADLASRMDNGFMHTSFYGAPSWRYDGFGPWMDNVSQYYNDFYSRDSGRAIMTLTSFGYDCAECAQKAVEHMKYFSRNNITFNGKKVPDHFTMVMNIPNFYHDTLTKVGWFTRYTPETFGKDYANLGNPETDGHGLMMMALGASLSPDELVKNASGAADYILWCLENPDITLAKDGVLYGETEATQGTEGYSVYANLPCVLGLYRFARAAQECGEAEKAQRWRGCADKLLESMQKTLSDGESWRVDCYGYYHDCTLPFASDLFGYDVDSMPPWAARYGRNGYEADVSRSRNIDFDASGGMGYNTSMRLQSALLADNTKDAGRFLHQLLRMCYAPALPYPYLVPEASSYSLRLNAIRRQGDLGNLVQQAEVLKCFRIMLGVWENDEKTFVFPRLVSFNAQLPVKKGSITVKSVVKKGEHSIDIAFDHKTDKPVQVRFGPFEDETAVTVLNGKTVQGQIKKVGDAWWSYFTASGDLSEV